GGFAALFADAVDGVFERPFERVVAFLERAGGANHLAAFGREQFGDRLADAAARTGHDHNLPIELAHWDLPDVHVRFGASLRLSRTTTSPGAVSAAPSRSRHDSAIVRAWIPSTLSEPVSATTWATPTP